MKTKFLTLQRNHCLSFSFFKKLWCK